MSWLLLKKTVKEEIENSICGGSSYLSRSLASGPYCIAFPSNV